MKPVLGLLLALAPLPLFAQVPHQFELTYRFTFNGHYVGNVTDRFQRLNGQRYQLTSLAKPEGSLALLLPSLSLTSRGAFDSEKLIPTSYRQARSNAPDKAALASLDWSKGTLVHQYKGESKQETLPRGTQDALSQLYLFSILDKLPATLEIPVTNGRRLLKYRYEQRKGPAVQTPMGSFETVEYRRVTDPGDNAISVWIAPGLHRLPLRIRVQEESGVFEQQLIKLNYRAS